MSFGPNLSRWYSHYLLQKSAAPYYCEKPNAPPFTKNAPKLSLLSREASNLQDFTFALALIFQHKPLYSYPLWNFVASSWVVSNCDLPQGFWLTNENHTSTRLVFVIALFGSTNAFSMVNIAKSMRQDKRFIISNQIEAMQKFKKNVFDTSSWRN